MNSDQLDPVLADFQAWFAEWEGLGQTDFPPADADFGTIIQSIDRRLFTLPPDTIVMPGHGIDTTISSERPHLQEWVDRGW